MNYALLCLKSEGWASPQRGDCQKLFKQNSSFVSWRSWGELSEMFDIYRIPAARDQQCLCVCTYRCVCTRVDFHCQMHSCTPAICQALGRQTWSALAFILSLDKHAQVAGLTKPWLSAEDAAENGLPALGSARLGAGHRCHHWVTFMDGGWLQEAWEHCIGWAELSP